VTVTGDEMRAQDMLKDLRETQTKLEEARAEIAALKVLLALRTRQHDQAWQAARRAARECEVAPAPTDAAGSAGAAHAEAIARAEARTDAVRVVLGAVLASLRIWGLDRRRFQRLVIQAGRDAPVAGPGAERHAIFLAEARRILGRTE